jgi:cell division protein FtsI (penicillin-binding protein 3)
VTRSRRSSRGAPHLRLRTGLIAITVLLTIFGARLGQIQGIDAATYAERAGTSGLVTVDLPADRGRIVARDGEPLAESVSGLMLVADPQTTAPRAEAIAKILADRLDLDYFDQLERLQKPDTRFVYLARRVPSTLATEVIEELRGLQFAGVDTRPDPLRTYPSGDVGGNLVGFLGDDGKPLAGLELAFESYLAGTDGEETYEVGGGNRIPLGDRSKVDAVDGRDLRLTIDRDVQWFSQRTLCSAVQQVDADWGAAVVMDTETGELLALADCPTVSPRAPGRTPKDSRGSRAVTDVYEPGSVEKVLTFAGLLDARRITPETQLTVPGELSFFDGQVKVNDFFDHGDLRMTAAGALARSSNIGTTLAAEELEYEELRDYLSAFGLGAPTDLGLAAEGVGQIPSLDGWNELTHSQVSFGQGLSVNAVQMAAAVNTIANDGLRVAPSLIEGRHTNGAGQEVGTETAQVQRVVSEEAAEQTARMMELVTDSPVGTAPTAAIPGYRVAGKTGTAQQAGGDCRCYDGGYNAVSFGGFAPADDARFTAYVVVSNPRNGGSGSGTAAPVFRKIMNYVLQRYAVPPTGEEQAAYPTRWRPAGAGGPGSDR